MKKAPINQGSPETKAKTLRSRRRNEESNLRGEDLEVDTGEALEVLLEEALGVVLPDLLARHGCRRERREVWVLEGSANQLQR
jgi:hypothetical protein